MAQVAELKFTAKLVCIQSLLDFAEETSKRKLMIGYFNTGCYSAVSEEVLRRLIDHYPTHLTNGILEALAPHHFRELKLKKCTSVSVNGLRSVLEKCCHLSMLDLTECDQFAVPTLFTQISSMNIHLTALSLESCSHVDDVVVKTVLKHIRSLQHLNISTCDITDRVFLLNEELQLGRELCNDVSEFDIEVYESELVSIDLSGCRSISSTAIRHLCTLCGPTLKNVNIAWTGVDCMSLLYLAGYNLPSVVQIFLNLNSNESLKFPTELEECLEELHKTMETMYKHSKSEPKECDVNTSDRVNLFVESSSADKHADGCANDTAFRNSEIDGLQAIKHSPSESQGSESVPVASVGSEAVSGQLQSKDEHVLNVVQKVLNGSEGHVDDIGEILTSTEDQNSLFENGQYDSEPNHLEEKTSLSIDDIGVILAEQNLSQLGNIHFMVENQKKIVDSENVELDSLQRLNTDASTILLDSSSSNVHYPGVQDNYNLVQNGAFSISHDSLNQPVSEVKVEKGKGDNLENWDQNSNTFIDLKNSPKLICDKEELICDTNDISTKSDVDSCKADSLSDSNVSNCITCNALKNMVKQSIVNLSQDTETCENIRSKDMALTNSEETGAPKTKSIKENPDSLTEHVQQLDKSESDLLGNDRVINPLLQIDSGVSVCNQNLDQIPMSSHHGNCQNYVSSGNGSKSADENVCDHNSSPLEKNQLDFFTEESVYMEVEQNSDVFHADEADEISSHESDSNSDSSSSELEKLEKMKSNKPIQLCKTSLNRFENIISKTENISASRMYQPSLSSIDISSIQFIDDSIGRQCLKMFVESNKSLQKFGISWKFFNDQMLNVVASNLSELREITLVDCESLTTVGISDLGFKCQNLQKVDLKGVYNIKNLAIYPYLQLPDLESLCLAECGISDGTLFRIGARCTEKLKELDLSWCDDITERGINFLCTKCKKLESLSLRHCLASTLTLGLIAENIKGLTYLNLCSVESIDNESVINLVENLHHLETIDLSWNSGLEDRSIMALFRACTQLRTAILAGLKRITSQPFLPIISEIDKWRRCQKLMKFKLKERGVLEEMGDPQLSSDEEFEDLYMPHRSTVYAANLRLLDLEYCDRVTDQHLAEIVAVCRESLQIIDYYSEKIKPALFTK